MAKAVALTRSLVHRSADAMRVVIVTGCALALIAAGQAFPF
ncbi:hypothetical protein [Croceibacterium salegens]|nr:hypothetical protein [Croceibacterium salegens]